MSDENDRFGEYTTYYGSIHAIPSLLLYLHIQIKAFAQRYHIRSSSDPVQDPCVKFWALITYYEDPHSKTLGLFVLYPGPRGLSTVKAFSAYWQGDTEIGCIALLVIV